MPNTIDHPSQLDALSVLPLMRPVSRHPVLLAGELSHHPMKEKWESQLNRLQRECGCGFAGVAMFAGVLIGTVLTFFVPVMHSGGLLSSSIWIGTIAIACAIVGKFIALIGIQKRLRNVIEEIQQQWMVGHPSKMESMEK